MVDINGVPTPYSLTDDTQRGANSSYDILFKYMKVIDDKLVNEGTPKDNVMHLQGAVRLIRRALTEPNPALDLLNVFCIKFLKSNTVLIPYSFYPPKQFFAAYKLDYQDAEEAYEHSAFEVLAPFDIGASVHDDIDPILAVLSNIISRGLPSKASPFLEKVFSDTFGNTKESNPLGSIVSFSTTAALNNGVLPSISTTLPMIMTPLPGLTCSHGADGVRG